MIEFPGLWGLKFNIDPVAIHLGKINVYWYGLIIAIGFALAVYLATRHSKDFGIESESIIDMVLWATIPSIIFARLFYVAFSWDYYKGDLMKIINIREGGIAIYGALIGAVLAAFIFAKKRKIPYLKLFDFAIPYFVLAQAIGRWGNFVNQEAFGSNTTLPWGMTSDTIKNYLTVIPGANPALPVHPTFLYESLWNLGAFFLLIYFRKRKKIEGEVFFLYMILYGLGRAWIEGLRTDSLMLGNLRISQVLAVLFVLGFSALFYFRRKKTTEVDDNEVVIGTSKYGAILKEMEKQEPVNKNTVEEVQNEEKSSDDKTEIETNMSNLEENEEEHKVDINKV